MMKTSHMLIILAGIVAVGAATYIAVLPRNDFSYTPPAQQLPGHGVVGKTSLDTDPYDVLITYTDDGFSPSDISISSGQRVRFLNNSSAQVWPASGVHPTHSLYPEKESTDCLGSSFDACTGLAKGEFYDFTFYYPGHWTFHDHLHAYHSGSVTVAANPGE